MQHVITERHAGLIRWFLEKHRPSLGRAATLLFGSIDDAVQELWTICWERAPRWSTEWSTRTLVTKTIVFVLCSRSYKIGRLLYAQSQSATYDSPQVQWLADPSSGRDTDVVDSQLDAAAMLARLAPRTADMLASHHAQDQTFQTIANRWGISKQGVAHICAAAKTQLLRESR